MRLLICFMLAVCVAASSTCFIETIKMYTEKRRFRMKDGRVVGICLLQVLRYELAPRAKRRLALTTAGLYALALAIIAGALVYGVLFIGSGKFLVPAVLLAMSAVLVFLLGRHVRFIRYLILCCAARAVSKVALRNRKNNIANTNDLQ